jgi:hypothetical protein
MNPKGVAKGIARQAWKNMRDGGMVDAAAQPTRS